MMIFTMLDITLDVHRAGTDMFVFNAFLSVIGSDIYVSKTIKNRLPSFLEGIKTKPAQGERNWVKD